jgi:hypothetical protein
MKYCLIHEPEATEMSSSMHYIRPALYAVIALAILLLHTIPAIAETTGTVEVNPRLVRLGVPFTVTVEISSDENIQNPQVDFPEPEGLHLSGNISQGVNLVAQGGTTEVTHDISREYTADEAGVYEVGPFRVTYVNEEGETEELELELVSVEVFEDAPREASTIIPGTMPWWWPYLITVICLAILAGLVGGWYALKRKRRPEAAAAPVQIGPRSPEQNAYDAVAALTVPDANEEEAVKEYYDAVDDILRVYLTKRYNVPTRDATLWEIRQEFNRRKRMDSRVKGVFEMMNDCDWVKFAKMKPKSGDIDGVKVWAADVLLGQRPAEVEGVA